MVSIQVFEGERALTRNCHSLGKFDLTNLPPAPRGVPQIEVTLDVDVNGILNVSAVEKGSGKTNKITITNDSGRLSKDEINKMVSDAEQYKVEDEKEKERITAKNNLEAFIFNAKSSLEDPKVKEKLEMEEVEGAMNKLKEALTWLERNQQAEVEEYRDKQQELEQISRPIMSKLYGQQNPSSSCGQEERTGGQGPTIEEVD